VQSASKFWTPAICGDRVQLMQVMLNLVMNGAEAMSAAADPRDMTITSRSSPDGEVHVSVADTGVGLDAAAAARCGSEDRFGHKPPVGRNNFEFLSAIAGASPEFWSEPSTASNAFARTTRQARNG
jgi:hypothetical protein